MRERSALHVGGSVCDCERMSLITVEPTVRSHSPVMSDPAPPFMGKVKTRTFFADEPTAVATP